jgi:ferredoxin
MKKMLLYTILAILALWAVAAINTDQEITSFTGVIEHHGSHLWLENAAKEEVHLLLAPQAVLDTLGFKCADGDTVKVEGIRDKDLMLVGKLWNESDGGKVYNLRDFETGDIYPGGSTYGVDTKKCIACKLCLMNCPTGAITMVNGRAHIDPEKCTECGICIEGHGTFKGCPVKAIHAK